LSGYGGSVLLAAAAALAMSPASAGCEPPAGAKVLAESSKVVVWRRRHELSACAKRTGRTRNLASLESGLRVLRIFLPGERVVAAFRGKGFSEMALYRFGRSREPVFLSAGFGDVTELVRSRQGHFAWIETTGGETGCPCSVIAGDAHERFVVARRRRRPTDLAIGRSVVAFESREGYEEIHVPFVTQHRIDVRPDPGGPHSQFRMTVTLPRIIPAHGRVRAEIDTQTATGDDCNGTTIHSPRQRVTRDGRRRRITLTTRDDHWCAGSSGGFVSYEWRRHDRLCSLAHPNCSGFIRFGRFRLRVSNPDR
jgi:hypothetical protein